MNKTLATLTDPEMPTITPDTIIEIPKMDVEITYLKNNNIDEAIHQKLSKKDLYKTDMHKIYNIILVQTNMQLQKKEELGANFQTIKTGRDPIGYLMIPKKLCF